MICTIVEDEPQQPDVQPPSRATGYLLRLPAVAFCLRPVGISRAIKQPTIAPAKSPMKTGRMKARISDVSVVEMA